MEKLLQRLTSLMTRSVAVMFVVAQVQLSGCKGDQRAPRAGTQVGTKEVSASETVSKPIGFADIHQLLGAINTRDWSRAERRYNRQARWSSPASGAKQPAPPPVVGREAVVSIWKDLVQWIPDLRVVPLRVIKLASGFVVETWVGGRVGDAAKALGFASGARLGVHAVEVLTTKGHEIVSVVAYGDGATARAQLTGKAQAVAPPAANTPALEVTGPASVERVEQARTALGVAEPTWAQSVGDVVVLVHEGTLWVVELDEAGQVTAKRAYASSL